MTAYTITCAILATIAYWIGYYMGKRNRKNNENIQGRR